MRFLVLSLLIPLLWSGALFSRNPQEYADSLEGEVQGATGEARFELFHRLAETYQRINIDRAVSYCDSAHDMALALDRPDLLALALNSQGKLHHMKGHYILAARHFSSALTYARKGQDQKLIMLINNALGISYLMTGDFPEAFGHFSEVEAYFRETGQLAQVASTLLNIGSLYKMSGEPQKAIDVLSESLNLATNLEHQELELKCLSALGKVYESTGELEAAMTYQIRALEIGEERQYPALIISTKNSIGQLAQKQGDYVLARQYYQEALEVAREARIALLVQSLTVSLGRLAWDQKNHWEALELLTSAELQAEKLESEGAILEVLGLLAGLYEEMGNFQKALGYHKRFHDMMLERNEKLHSERMQELMAAFNAEASARRIDQMEKERLLARYRTLGVALVALFAVLALGALYFRYRERQRSYTILDEQHRKIQRQNQILQDQFREIEDKNNQLAQKSHEIKARNQELQLLNVELTHFARAASHDLREPLRAIRSYMNLLGTRYEKNFDNKAREFLSMASAGAVRMEDLLNDLYEHAKVGRSKESFSKVNVETLVKEVISDLHVTILEKEALVAYEHLPVLQGIRTELRILIQNLLGNALKFTSPGEVPKVMIRGTEDEHNHFIEVQDHGIGIPEEYHAKIFQIFERLNSREDYEGSGIGLATCQKIVQHHGGDIQVSSRPGFGTTFRIRLPKS